MPRVCTACTHAQRPAIDRALVADQVPDRALAQSYGLSVAALRRHAEAHLPARLAKAQEAREVAQADSLLTELRALRSKAYSLLLAAERVGDYRTALAGVREARATLELLAELEGELDRRPTINLLVAPEWLQVRSALLDALLPYPEARLAVVGSLKALNAA